MLTIADLSADEAREELKSTYKSSLAMRSYINTAQLTETQAERITKQSQIDLMMEGAEDPMVQAFQKRAKTEFDKKLKDERKAPKETADGTGGIRAALEKQAEAFAKIAHAIGGGGRGRGAPGGGGKGAGRGDGGKGRNGSPGDNHYRGCFVCGSKEHKAADCPTAH